MSLLREAIEKNDIVLAESLVKEGADVDGIDEDKDSHLHVAVLGGKIEIAKMLIENGAQINLQTKCGATPIYLASYGFHEGCDELVKILIEKGADVNQTSMISTDTPLHNAAFKNNLVIAQMLLNAGADVYFKNDYNRTPLTLTKAMRNGAMINMLQTHCKKSITLQYRCYLIALKNQLDMACIPTYIKEECAAWWSTTKSSLADGESP